MMQYRLTLFIYSQVSMLHDQKIPYKEMEEIKHKVSEIIRRHNPLEDLTAVDSSFTVYGNGVGN